MLPSGSSSSSYADAPIYSENGEQQVQVAPLAFGTVANQQRARRLWGVALEKWLEIGRRVTGLASGEPQPALPTQQFLVCLVELFGFVLALLRSAPERSVACSSSNGAQSALFVSSAVASSPAAAGEAAANALAIAIANPISNTSCAPGSLSALGEATLRQCIEVFYVCLLMPFPPNETGIYLITRPSPPDIAAFESISALLDPSAKRSDPPTLSARRNSSPLLIDPSRYMTRTTEDANITPLQDAVFKIFQMICQVVFLN